MLVAAKEAQCQSLVYASSSSVYGDHPGLPKIEEAIGCPLSPYAASKRINEVYADAFRNLWNVLKGEMSLVGPRPEQHEFVQVFNQTIPLYKYRQIVKPGITGLAQITRGYTSDAEGTKEKL